MADDKKRFRAFISYSWTDREWAQRLHRSLESYRVPLGVVADVTDVRKLGRFFRDTEDMPASSNIAATVRGAIEDSESLIVVCSPASAKSIWVNSEIEHFRKTNRADRIFAFIVDGTPNSGDPATECFAPALRFRDEAKDASGLFVEPMGINVGLDGKAKAIARVAAGLLQVDFDSLWQRDRRRFRVQAAGAAAAAGVIIIALGALGGGWMRESQLAAAERLEQALAAANADVAEGRVAIGLARLKPFSPDAGGGRVRAFYQSVLSWARPIRDQIADMAPQTLFRYRGGLFLTGGDGQVHEISGIGSGARRIIKSADGRRLLFVDDFRSVVVDATSGEQLSEIKNDEVDWNGYAFETSSGILVVMGTRYAATNGGIIEAAMVISPDGRETAGQGLAQYVSLRSVHLVGRCQGLAVLEERVSGGMLAQELFFGETRLGEPNEVDASSLLNLGKDGDNDRYHALGEFKPSSEINETDLLPSNPFVQKGCKAVAADSRSREQPLEAPKTVVAGRSGGSAAQWIEAGAAEPFARDGDFGGLDDWMHHTIEDEADSVYSKFGETFWSNRWRSLPVPPALPPQTASMDEVNGSRMAYTLDPGNAYVTTTVCRKTGADPKCLEVRASHRESPNSQSDIRSPNGRYLFVKHGGTILNLVAFKQVTGDRELPIDSFVGQDFEPDIDQITITRDGGFIAFAPESDGGVWRRLGNGAPTAVSVLASETGETPKVAGLIALGGKTYIVAREDGVIARIDPQGRSVWSITANGLGGLTELRASPDRSRFMVSGAAGLRVFDSADGAVQSPILALPMQQADRGLTEECSDDLRVLDDRSVTVVCVTTGTRHTWAPAAFAGNVTQAIARLSCDLDEKSTALEALKNCLG